MKQKHDNDRGLFPTPGALRRAAVRRGLLPPVLLAGLALLVAAAFTGCLTASAGGFSEPGQVLWDGGSDPQRDAPRWVESEKAALKEAGVRRSEIPKKYVVYIGVSEDKPDERAAQFSAVEDMLKRYAVYLQKELDRILPEAAEAAGVRLPDVNTALGADMAVSYLPRGPIETGVLRAHWTARGKLCPDGTQPVYRVYVLGAFDRETRRAHLKEAAVETFKYAIISGENKDKILERAEKLIKKI